MFLGTCTDPSDGRELQVSYELDLEPLLDIEREIRIFSVYECIFSSENHLWRGTGNFSRTSLISKAIVSYHSPQTDVALSQVEQICLKA